MFVVVQIPFADLRPMIKGQMGRVSTPDWTADDPGDVFVRGFGKIATRNSKAFGLLGERFYADFNRAVRLRGSLTHRGPNWPVPITGDLMFRRLYFDGRMAGRFEFGFLVGDDLEERLQSRFPELAIDPRVVAAEALALHIGVAAPSCPESATTIRDCAMLLGQAYLAATTNQSALNAYPPLESYGVAAALGPPLVQIRLSNGLGADVGRDRAEADGMAGKLFFTSASDGRARMNVIVCLSEAPSQAESSAERAVRVLLSHLNALLFAQSHFLRVQKEIDLGGRSPLREAVSDMIARLSKFTSSAPKSENDKEFSQAMSLFGTAYAGRTDELVSKLEDILEQAAKPSFVGASLSWLNAISTLILTTGIKAVVEQTMKPG